MSTKNRVRLHAVIDARLSAIATSLREPPPWNEPWLRLGTESTWEERLFVCQAVRNSGSIPAEAGYFLVSWIIEDRALVTESDRLDSLEFMNWRESRELPIGTSPTCCISIGNTRWPTDSAPISWGTPVAVKLVGDSSSGNRERSLYKTPHGSRSS